MIHDENPTVNGVNTAFDILCDLENDIYSIQVHMAILSVFTQRQLEEVGERGMNDWIINDQINQLNRRISKLEVKLLRAKD